MFGFGLRKEIAKLKKINKAIIMDNHDLSFQLMELGSENDRLKCTIAAQGALVGAFAEYIVMKHNPKAKKLNRKKGQKNGKKK